MNDLKTPNFIEKFYKDRKSKNNAIQYVQNGGALIIFPSGEVATRQKIFEKAIEKRGFRLWVPDPVRTDDPGPRAPSGPGIHGSI